MTYDYVVLGAGISGALVAAQLRHLNKSVMVIDKGRSVGGRLSCKRMGDASFNHGLQNFECSLQNRKWATDLIDESIIAKDFPHKILVPANQIVKKVLGSCPVTIATEIQSIKLKNSVYYITCSQQRKWRAKKIICTFPTVQTLKLVSSLLSPENIAALKNVVYKKKLICFVASPLPIPSCADFSVEYSKNYQMITFAEKISTNYFELTDLEIIDVLQKMLIPTHDGIESNCITVKKWRYALCTQPIEQKFMLSQNNSLMLIGDAFGNPADSSLERAISSAESILGFLHTADSFG